MTAPQSPQRTGPVLGEEAREAVGRVLTEHFAGTSNPYGWNPAVDAVAALLAQARADGVEEGRGDMERLEREWRADERREAESAPWLLDLVHAAETAGGELGCNGDHEGNEGCDGCAWEALAAAVPAKVRNAADERASKP